MNLKEIFRKHLYLFEEVAFGNFNLSQDDLNEILKGYLESAVWTEEERLNDDYKSTVGYDDAEYDDDTDYEDEVERLIKLKQKMERKPFSSFIVEDIEPNSRIQAYLDIKTFIKNAGQDAIAEAVQENGWFKLGMDIWLTRNGHGAGFFDHSYEHEKVLMDAARALREVDLYLTDNITLAFSNA